MGLGIFFTPERYPEIEERERDRRAMQEWQPPVELQLNKFLSPIQLGPPLFPPTGSERCPAHRLDDSSFGDVLDDDLLNNAYLMTPGAGGIRGANLKTCHLRIFLARHISLGPSIHFSVVSYFVAF